MTRRAWTLIVLGYAILALGAVVTAFLFTHQSNELDATNHRLVKAVAAYCEIALLPDKLEDDGLRALARGSIVLSHPTCREIAIRLHGRTN
jgi:hypothetical protein